MSLLPSSPDVSPDGDPRLVGLDSDEAGELMAALSSETARRLLAELHEDPAPPGELADRVDTSLQNAQYHLEKLENAGAVEVVGTAYSEKGREMAVYGPADSPLVIYAGEQERASGLRAALSRLFGGILALAVGAVAIQELFGRSLLGGTGNGVGGAGGGAGDGGTEGGNGDDTDVRVGSGEKRNTSDSAESAEGETATAQDQVGIEEATQTDTPAATGAPEPTETPMDTPAPEPTGTAVEDGGAADNALDVLFEGLLGGGLPPGVAFFIGGLTVLSVVVATTYLRARP